MTFAGIIIKPLNNNNIQKFILLIIFRDTLLALVRDKYGNYVVQKLIEVADSKMKENMVKRIIHSQAMKKRDGFCNLLLIKPNM